MLWENMLKGAENSIVDNAEIDDIMGFNFLRPFIKLSAIWSISGSL